MARGDDLVLKISADTTAVASGLKPMSTALTDMEDDTRGLETELKKLDSLSVSPSVDASDVTDASADVDKLESDLKTLSRTDVEISVKDQAIADARSKMDRLRDEIAQNIILDIDTKTAQRELSNLQTAVKRLTDEKHSVEIDVKPDDVIEKTASGMEGLREGARETASSLGGLSSGFTGVTLVAGAALEAVSDLNEMLTENRLRAQEAGESVGKFQKGVGSVTSFLSGPWGLAVAGATILLGQWAQSQDEAEAATQSLSDAIDFQAGAMDRNNRLNAAKQLEDKKLLELAEKNNLSTTDMTDALLGNADAQARVNGALDVLGQRYKQLKPFIESYKDDFNSLVRVNAATATSQDRVREAVGLTSDDIEDQTDTLDDATKAYENLINAMDIYNQRAADARQLTSDYEETVVDLEKALKENKHTLDLTTDAGRKNDALVREQAENIAQLTEARLKDAKKTGESTDDILADYQSQRDSLRDTMIDLGLSKKEADKYTDALLKTPKKIKTEVEVTLTPNLDKFNALPKRLQDAISGNGSVNVGVQSQSAPAAPSTVVMQPRVYLDSRPIRAAIRGDVETLVGSTVAMAGRKARL